MEFVRSILLILFSLAFFLAPKSLAQGSKSKDKTTRNMVRLIFNLDANADKELKAEEVKIIEDGIPQKVHSFDKQNQSISYGLLIDTSGSMKEYMPAVRILAFSLIDQISDSDEMLISSVNLEPELATDFTSNKDNLVDALNSLYTRGGTSLFDGLVATADYMKEKAKNSRRVLVVLTDILERNSSIRISELVSAVAEDDIQVFVIRVNNSKVGREDIKPIFGKSAQEQALEKGFSAFKYIVTFTGGLLMQSGVPLKIKKDEVPGLIEEARNYTSPIIQISKSRYRISYLPTNQNIDGKQRRVQIQWRDENGKMIMKDFIYETPKK